MKSGFSNSRRIPRNLSMFRFSADVLQIGKFWACVLNVILETPNIAKREVEPRALKTWSQSCQAFMAQSRAKSSLRSSFLNLSEAVSNALSADAASRPNERVIRQTWTEHSSTLDPGPQTPNKPSGWV